MRLVGWTQLDGVAWGSTACDGGACWETRAAGTAVLALALSCCQAGWDDGVPRRCSLARAGMAARSVLPTADRFYESMLGWGGCRTVKPRCTA